MSLNTDSILFLFLFILPGALSKILIYEFAPRKKCDDGGFTAVMEFAKIIVASSVVFAINILILQRIDSNNDPQRVITLLDSQGFLIRYIILTIGTTIVYTGFVHFLVAHLIRKGINIYNSVRKKPQELKFPTVWENIFEDNAIVDLANKDHYVSIEKNGAVITRGKLEYYPAPHTKCNEFGLKYCVEAEAYFEHDKQCTKDEYKIFHRTVIEYYNMEYDVLIKFYDMQLFNEHQNQVILAEEASQERN